VVQTFLGILEVAFVVPEADATLAVMTVDVGLGIPIYFEMEVGLLSLRTNASRYG